MDTEKAETKTNNSYRNVLFKKTQSIEKALEIAYRYGQIDGAHHKQWVIDQMVQTLLDNSSKYKKAIKDYEFLNDEGKYDEEKIYVWDIGIAP
jgi:hypothetical protein